MKHGININALTVCELGDIAAERGVTAAILIAGFVPQRETSTPEG